MSPLSFSYGVPSESPLAATLGFFFLQPAIGTTDAVRLRCGRVVYTIWEMPRAPLGYRCRNVTGLRCWFGARDVIMLRCSRIAVYITSGSDTAAKVVFDDIPCALVGVSATPIKVGPTVSLYFMWCRTFFPFSVIGKQFDRLNRARFRVDIEFQNGLARFVA